MYSEKKDFVLLSTKYKGSIDQRVEKRGFKTYLLASYQTGRSLQKTSVMTASHREITSARDLQSRDVTVQPGFSTWGQSVDPITEEVRR